MALRVAVRQHLLRRLVVHAAPAPAPAAAQSCRSRALSSATPLQAGQLRRAADSQDNGNPKKLQKRKAIRSSAASLEAKQSRQDVQGQQSRARTPNGGTKSVTAYCAAEEYLIERVARVLNRAGHVLDPFQTCLFPDVVHFQMPSASIREGNDATAGDTTTYRMGDVFVFPSGTLVAWDVSESQIQSLLDGALREAAVNPHPQHVETEDLDYFEDPASRKSGVVGDTLRIGTEVAAEYHSHDAPQQQQPRPSEHEAAPSPSHNTDLALTKIAFSAALARSTKVAVLESLLDAYFASTQALPGLLSQGARLPRHYSRRFILRKTGELLSVRAQLNLTELTDRTPDLFWDTRHELGLEARFDQVGKALDLNWRIKVLNERVDYAREIAEVLREELKGRHGELLEWLIIGLIAVEVGFEGCKLLRDYFAHGESTEQLARRYFTERLGEGAT